MKVSLRIISIGTTSHHVSVVWVEYFRLVSNGTKPCNVKYERMDGEIGGLGACYQKSFSRPGLLERRKNALFKTKCNLFSSIKLI